MSDISKMRVLRVARSGVWLCAEILGEGELPGTVSVRGRRAHSWSGALDCSSLATSGPSGGKVSAETTVDLRVEDIFESHRMTADAVAAVRRLAVAS